ncbi:MAG: ABC transporter substrate-binding protein [Bacillota bacterium]
MNRNAARILRLVLMGIALAVLVVALSGCGLKKTFTDGTGRTVSLKGAPKRIVSLNPAQTETLFALGLGDRVVGVDTYSYRPAEAAKKEKVGDAFNLNLEKLVSLKPDLVILAGSKDMPPSQLKDMDRLGIPAYVSGPSTVKEVLADIESLSKVLGAEKQGKELVAKMQKDLDAVTLTLPKDAGERPKVFIVVDQNLWTVGPGSFLNDVIAVAGGENVMHDAKQQYLQVSMEDLVAKDPDAIVVAIPEDQAEGLAARPAWADLRAVKAGKVYFVDPDLVSRPGPAVVDGIKEVAACLSGGK